MNNKARMEYYSRSYYIQFCVVCGLLRENRLYYIEICTTCVNVQLLCRFFSSDVCFAFFLLLFPCVLSFIFYYSAFVYSSALQLDRFMFYCFIVPDQFFFCSRQDIFDRRLKHSERICIFNGIS